MNGKDRVRAKKFLGQHFLKDEAVAKDIVDALKLPEGLSTVLEIGPGMGVLTYHLLQKKGVSLYAVELDRESVAYLITHFPELQGRLIEGDFLQLDLKALLPEPFAIIGNFPYNISTQILFRVGGHVSKGGSRKNLCKTRNKRLRHHQCSCTSLFQNELSF